MCFTSNINNGSYFCNINGSIKWIDLKYYDIEILYLRAALTLYILTVCSKLTGNRRHIIYLVDRYNQEEKY